MSRPSITLTGIAVLALVALPTPGISQTMGEKLHIEAFAVNMSNIGTGSSQVVMLDIDQWSTDRKRESLIDTMLQSGQDAHFDKKDNRIELENYASEPVRLQNVKASVKKT